MINGNDAQNYRILALFSSQLGRFIVKYLGIRFDYCTPTEKGWQDLIDKVDNKLASWKGKTLLLLSLD